MSHLSPNAPLSASTRHRGARLAFGIVLAAAGLLSATSQPTRAAAPPKSYSFDLLGTLSQAAPGIPGMYLVRDAEFGSLNESGSSLTVIDISSTNAPAAASVGEALYLSRHGEALKLIAHSGGTDPDGEVFYGAQNTGALSPVGLNNAGDGAFAWLLAPVPTGGADSRLHSGLYRYDKAHDEVTTIAKTGSPAPGGGTFEGFSFGVSMNGRGDVTFQGITKTTAGTYTNPANLQKYGLGVYLADAQGNISAVVEPGDPAPSGGYFDNLRNSWINDRGDIVFGGHTTADPACTSLGCAESIYLLPKGGPMVSVAHRNDVAPVPMPGTWTFNYAFGPRITNQGDVVFIGCIQLLPATTCGSNRGVFLYRDGAVQTVVAPTQVFQAEGDSYTAIRASNTTNNYFVNSGGEVVFTLSYNADVDGDAYKDTGVFTWADGVFEVVAKTGDVIPGVGTIRQTEKPATLPTAGPAPSGYSMSNNHGQIIFQVTLTDATGAMLVATP